jgi:predicted transcriptional regulator
VYRIGSHLIRRLDKPADIRSIKTATFEAERHLVSHLNLLVDQIPLVPPITNRIAFEELKLAGWLPDMLIVSVSTSKLRRRLDLHVNYRLSLADAVILTSLSHTVVKSTEEIGKITGIREKELKKYMRVLTKERIVESSPKGLVRLTKGYTQFLERVISIEAKLSKWHDAVFQASRNTLFSDYSYVALDKLQANGALQASHEFSRNGVGLILAMQTSQSLEIKIKSPRSSRLSGAYRYLLQDALLSENRHGLLQIGGHYYG